MQKVYRKTVSAKAGVVISKSCCFSEGLFEKQSQKPSLGRKSEILSPKSETDRMEAKRQIPAHFKECNLKKQSQFAKGQNGVKYLYERVL